MLSFILYKIYYNIYNPEYLKLLKEDAYRLSLNDNYDITDGPKFLKSKYKIYKNSYEQTLYDDSNIFSWIMQFIGHGIFEGNRPALMDSIKQAFLMAPLFSYYEFKELLER